MLEQIISDVMGNLDPMWLRMLAPFALLSCSAFTPRAMPPQTIAVGLTGDADGTVFLELNSVGRPFTFDAQALRFTGQAYDRRGHLTKMTYDAHPIVARWEPVKVYPSYIDTSADSLVVRRYRARIDFGRAPGDPGLYASTPLQTPHSHAPITGLR